MKYLTLLLIIFGVQCLKAQTPAPTTPAAAADNRKYSLEERFQLMRSKAESYQDYKVIKSTTLDAEWKIIMDSIRASKSVWQDAKRSIAIKEGELKNSQLALEQKEASMTDVNYASTHISFMGISFSKSTFVILCLVLVLGLLAVVGGLFARLKLMSATVHEKADLAEVTMKEFEEYKTKALEKQTKLSRELQNERNKLSEMRHN